MAANDIDSSATPVVPGSDGVKKKTRLNPARRKSAKARLEASEPVPEPPLPTSTTAPAATVPGATQPVKQNNKSMTPTIPNNQLSKQVSKPATVQRQNTESAATIKKPTLQRAMTAPEPANNKNRSLGFKAPAIVTGGLVGCAAGAAILLGVGMWYDFSGAESAILTAKAAKLCVDNLTEELITSLKAGTYSGDEALDMLRRTTLAYASTIPEGAPFVEKVFLEIDTVRKQRGREIDRTVADTYTELSKAGLRGAKSDEMRSIVIGQLMKLSSFASRATQDVVTRNPKLRPYRDDVSRSLQGAPKSKTPTVRVNMAVRQKQAM